ncbi:MAG: SPOR domain-containing protein [Gammaproteobacteria bacterium]|nr:SPOR domain-containing protein [Gammaproteobacteria bacterium]
MKNLFLVLVLANGLFIGWRLWIAPAEVPAAQLLEPGPEPQVVALPRQGAGAAVTGDAPDAGEDQQRCWRVGPLADGQLADTLRSSLVARGIGATVMTEEGQVWVGHWVQLESVASRQEADSIAARLMAGGLPDAYVLQTSPPFSISLGVFRDRERADAVAAQAARIGFRPQVTDRYRAGLQFWLTLVVPAGTPFSAEGIGRETGQILRSEATPCAAGTIGEAPASD